MSRIQEAFRAREEDGSKLFIPYLCSGDPNMDLSYELVRTVEDAGADIIELGIPFSDPLADGPTIQKATQRSLDNGTRMRQVFELVENVRDDSEVPLVLMTYYNPIFRYGEERFLQQAQDAGVDGVLVVDLPPEEGLDFYDTTADFDLETILLATPTTQPDRIESLSELATGFLYYVMVTGVTGVRSGYNPDLARKLETVSERSQLPTVVGFGVSDIYAISDYLETIRGVVSGSYLIDGINENLGDPDAIKDTVHDRASELASPLHNRDSSTAVT
jgi:tryptophan synthase alpha chain